MLVMMATAAIAVTAVPEGRRLKPIDQCFAIYRPGKDGDIVIGSTRQVVRAIKVDGRAAWDIVVNQSVPMAKFTMRDHFVLNRPDLSPIAFDNRRGGVEHVSLRYTPRHITGTKIDNGIGTPIDIAVPGRIWEGNLWGVTFGALPLKEGARFTLPFYQYDSGLGSFTLTVSGSEDVVTPEGPVEAWAVEVVKDGKPAATALIAKRDGRELGSRSARGGMKLGGDCRGLD